MEQKSYDVTTGEAQKCPTQRALKTLIIGPHNDIGFLCRTVCPRLIAVPNLRKRGGVQKSIGQRVPWKIGMLIYLPVTSPPLISLQKKQRWRLLKLNSGKQILDARSLDPNSWVGISPTIYRAQNPETPKSLKKVSREEFGTPRPRTPKKFRKRSEKSKNS